MFIIYLHNEKHEIFTQINISITIHRKFISQPFKNKKGSPSCSFTPYSLQILLDYLHLSKVA